MRRRGPKPDFLPTAQPEAEDPAVTIRLLREEVAAKEMTEAETLKFNGDPQDFTAFSHEFVKYLEEREPLEVEVTRAATEEVENLKMSFDLIGTF